MNTPVLTFHKIEIFEQDLIIYGSWCKDLKQHRRIAFAKEISHVFGDLLFVLGPAIFQTIHLTKRPRVQVMNSFKIGIEIFRILISRKNTENPTTLVVQHDNSEILRNIIVP